MVDYHSIASEIVLGLSKESDLVKLSASSKRVLVLGDHDGPIDSIKAHLQANGIYAYTVRDLRSSLAKTQGPDCLTDLHAQEEIFKNVDIIAMIDGKSKGIATECTQIYSNPELQEKTFLFFDQSQVSEEKIFDTKAHYVHFKVKVPYNNEEDLKKKTTYHLRSECYRLANNEANQRKN